MKKGTDKIFDYLALSHLAVVMIVCLFPNTIISLLSLDIELQLSDTNVPPLTQNFLLGSDYLGRDVLALLLNGARYSMSISVFSAILGTLIGLILGGVSGFLGDNKMKMSRAALLVSSLIIPLIIFYWNISLTLPGWDGVIFFGFIIMLGFLVGYLITGILSMLPIMRAKVSLPLDFLNMKFIEILFALPTYFVLLALSTVFDPSIYSLIFVIGITSWPKTALLIRTEMLKIREMDYAHALKLAGVPWYSVLLKHALPNAIGPVLVNFVFFASGLLVVESTLSYIGIGLPGEVISWGKVLAGFKYNSANWWTALFPGILIFATILSFHRVGKILRL
ncbi:MAG: ABC transporter permease [Cyclobacteriaceae bacterium]